MKYFLSLLFIIFNGVICLSQEKQLIFSDNSSLKVSSTNFDQKSPKIFDKPVTKIITKEFTALLTGIGKAFPPLDKKTAKNVGAKNKALARQISQIDSAYYLTQNDAEYYFAGFNSVSYAKFTDCSPERPCRVKLKSIIVQTKDSSNEENILILVSIKPSA